LPEVVDVRRRWAAEIPGVEISRHAVSTSEPRPGQEEVGMSEKRVTGPVQEDAAAADV
jgi:hypothetical protein